MNIKLSLNVGHILKLNSGVVHLRAFVPHELPILPLHCTYRLQLQVVLSEMQTLPGWLVGARQYF
jgi:hypothetical protein